MFTLPGITKTSHWNKLEDICVEIECLRSRDIRDKKVCPLRTLHTYIQESKKIRKTQTVFITTTKGTSVARATLACWTKSAMEKSGIDTSFFKPYSTRSAAVSKKASQTTSSLESVLQMGNWSGTSAFFKFYLRRVKYFSWTHPKECRKTFSKASIQQRTESPKPIFFGSSLPGQANSKSLSPQSIVTEKETSETSVHGFTTTQTTLQFTRSIRVFPVHRRN